MKLEEVLQQRGLVTDVQVAAAAAEAARTNTPTAFVLISQGFVTEQDVYEAQRELVAGDAGSPPPPIAPPGTHPAPRGPSSPAGPPAPLTPTEPLNTGPASPLPPLAAPPTFAPPTPVASSYDGSGSGTPATPNGEEERV